MIEVHERDLRAMERSFIVVSGLPASGKSTLAEQLAPALGLVLLDKDAILERLFDSKGVGDAAWRRSLSRESDRILHAEATASNGAVLVSHWRSPGMAPDSGTPTNWLAELSACVVNVHCHCSPELAARRFIERKRHAGHLDADRSNAELLCTIGSVAALGRLDIGPRVDVDTSRQTDLDAVLCEVRRAIHRCNGSE
jgi:glucokinase